MASSSDRGPLTAVVIAFVVLAIITAAIFYLNPHKTAELSLTKVDLFAPHTQFDASQGSLKVLGETAQSEDDLYVVAHVNITDKLRLPIFLFGWTATATFADGSTQDATVVPAQQLPRLGQIFPQLASLTAQQPFHDGDEIAPGTTASGSFVLLFPNTTEDQWHKKRSAVLTVELRNQEAQTIKLP
jgi:hypothetical protein